MTKTIEELKREMYDLLADVKSCVSYRVVPSCDLVRFEDSLEAYLEALRKAMVTINESTVSCAQHSAEAFVDLEARLSRMTEERDTIRNKLQAFEFANRSAVELLSEALREPSGLRKSSQAIPQQESEDCVSSEAQRREYTMECARRLMDLNEMQAKSKKLEAEHRIKSQAISMAFVLGMAPVNAMLYGLIADIKKDE